MVISYGVTRDSTLAGGFVKTACEILWNEIVSIVSYIINCHLIRKEYVLFVHINEFSEASPFN
jgi:hypothetical protein